MKKYKIIEESCKMSPLTSPIKTYRIQALKDIENTHAFIKKGDVGGWVQSTDNLSQEGTCWIFDNAIVFNDAKVLDDAVIAENAIVGNSAIVRNFAEVKGGAIIVNNAEISGCATIQGNAIVDGNAKVQNNAFVKDAKITDRAKICDNAKILGKDGRTVIRGFVKNEATISGPMTISSRAPVCCDISSMCEFNDLEYDTYVPTGTYSHDTTQMLFPLIFSSITEGRPHSISIYFNNNNEIEHSIYSSGCDGFGAPIFLSKKKLSDIFCNIKSSFITARSNFDKKINNKSIECLFDWLEIVKFKDLLAIKNNTEENIIKMVRASSLEEARKSIILADKKENIKKISFYSPCQFLGFYIYATQILKSNEPNELIERKTPIIYHDFLGDVINKSNIDLKLGNILFNDVCLLNVKIIKMLVKTYGLSSTEKYALINELNDHNPPIIRLP